MNLQSFIRDVPDFPKKGVLFRDIAPLLKDPKALQYVADEFGKRFDFNTVDLIAGVESRGFIFATLLAAKLGKGFLPLRKAGKLPPPVHSESYSLEYGRATLELQPGSGRLFVIDDVLATGGTLEASLRLCKKAGYQVEHVGVLINLTFLNQFKFREKEVISLIQY